MIGTSVMKELKNDNETYLFLENRYTDEEFLAK